MQLDRTKVAIRERSLLEISDLALHVVRRFSPTLLIMLAVGVIPMALLNRFLLGWMVDDLTGWTFARYAWNMVLLIFIEAPLATAAATMFLGDAMFLQPPTLRQVLANLSKLSGRLFICQGLLRGVLPAWVLVVTMSPDVPMPGDFLIPMLVFYLLFMRALRPYVNEIILLERNPLRAKSPRAITVGRRSSKLHSPNGGDLFGRYLGVIFVTCLLSMIVLFGMWFTVGTVFNDWSWGVMMIHVVFPAALWTVAGYMCVVRYLAYLDLRTRREGWAVELHMRAEANRLQKQVF